MRHWAAWTWICIAVLVVAPAAGQSRDVVVFAAASLKTALDEINGRYKADTAQGISAAYAASSALAKQIEAAAPADLFISADLDWMDYVQQRNLIRPDSRANLLGNKLVLIAAAESKIASTIAPNFPLAQQLGDGRLAMGDPAAVPAGKYAKAALQKLNVWASVESRIARTENVRAALLLVSRGEVPLGIVYQTDAAAEPKVRVVDAFPADSYPPIIYPVALVANSTYPGADTYLAHLKSAAARTVFEKQGFTVLAK